MPDRQYAIILGNLGNTCDRFCRSYKTQPTSMQMLEAALKLERVGGIELVGTWDVTPDNASKIKRVLDDHGKRCVSIIPDLFAKPEYGRGSFSAIDASVRRQAMEETRQMAEVAREMGCDLINLWLGQDGYDYLLTTDYEAQRAWLCEGIAELAEQFGDLRWTLEYKPKEPRCYSFIARMADTLLLAQETGRDNVGVTLDTGHAFVAGENVAEAFVLAKRAGDRLMHLHFNDNHGSWDDDMIVGSVHSVCYLEMLYWLDRCGYTGWLSMDQYPYREEAIDAISESIEWLVRFDQLVDKHRDEIDKLVQANDAVATSRFLRKTLL